MTDIPGWIEAVATAVGVPWLAWTYAAQQRDASRRQASQIAIVVKLETLDLQTVQLWNYSSAPIFDARVHFNASGMNTFAKAGEFSPDTGVVLPGEMVESLGYVGKRALTVSFTDAARRPWTILLGGPLQIRRSRSIRVRRTLFPRSAQRTSRGLKHPS